MKVLVVGAGGREDALAWKLKQSKKVSCVFTAPGNPGTAKHGTNVPIKADDLEGLLAFALKEKIDLTVIGPELPLTLGIVDLFEAKGLKVFGPSKLGAELERSKVFSKKLMIDYNIPTAKYYEFTTAEKALNHIRNLDKNNLPIVIKADGLAAGKGVFICQSLDDATEAIKIIMEKKEFGSAGDTIVIEDFLEGEEASFIAVTDGNTVTPFASSQDHKPVFDNDQGPNTGGMGAYSPAPVVTPELSKEIMEKIMIPAVRAMDSEGRPFKGVLYAGLMIKNGKAKVLEFNCRFGDPETQPLLMRLRTDIVDIMLASIDGTLDKITLEWDKRTALCVVMASEGYPSDYTKGVLISGLEIAEQEGSGEVVVFHAGTTEQYGKILTSGGRVLGVTALGSDIASAIKKAYASTEKIKFKGAHYRADIGQKAVSR